jgi:hypothetical protein
MRWGFFLYSPNQCGSSPILRVSTATCSLAFRPVYRYFFALCSQKSSKASFKSTHVQWSENRSIELVSTRSVCSIRNSVRKPKQIVLCPSICQNTTVCKTSSSAWRFQTPQFAKWLAFEVS